MRNSVVYYIGFIIWIFLIVSCRKPSERTCLKNAGVNNILKKEISLFEELIVNNDFDLTLIQDSLNLIEIEGGKNLIELLNIEEKNTKLILNNKNSCQFLRSYKKRIAAKLHYTRFNKITFTGSGSIINTGILTFDTLLIINENSSGSINLKVNANKVYSKIILGTTDVTISGKTNFSYAYNGSFGWINHKELITDDAACFNNSSGAVEIFSKQKLNAQLKGTGNVYVYGSPTDRLIDAVGKGQVIFK